jgi:hypothetical protein
LPLIEFPQKVDGKFNPKLTKSVLSLQIQFLHGSQKVEEIFGGNLICEQCLTFWVGFG